MKYAKRIVDTELWESKVFDEVFSPEDKYFYLYLLTNVHTSQLGIYKVSKKKIANEMGYSVESVTSLIDRFQNTYGMIMYNESTNEIAIKNYLKHAIVKGGKPVLDCLIKDESQINDKYLVQFILKPLKDDTSINDTVKDFVSLYINDNDNDNERYVNESYHESSDESSDIRRQLDEQTKKDFEIIYDIYPKKGTKASALESYKKWVQKSGRKVGGKTYHLTNKDIWYAVDNYVRTQEEKGTDLQYYKNFSTLINQILDWLVEEGE